MAKDKDSALRQLFEGFAASSGGTLSFKATTSSELAEELGFELARSPSPVYVFKVIDADGQEKKFVAYTSTLDGTKRPATRAEALGRSLAVSNGRLFEFNPFFLVYDYVEERMLAVPAVDLFGAFARHASTEAIPYSESASFSLSPSFQQKTISMYAMVREPDVWATSTARAKLSSSELVAFLQRVAQTQTVRKGEILSIVSAIKARLSASPGVPLNIGKVAPAISTYDIEAELAKLEQRDDAVQVEDRLWRMILTAITSSPAVILVGPPGTGKSALLRKAVGILSAKRLESGLPGIKAPLWATPDESWTARDLIGGETVVEGNLVFRPGWVLRAITENRWLVLDEANRGDLDRIFGALLTWLSGGHVTIGVDSVAADAKLIELGWTSGSCRVETDEGIPGQRPGVIRYLAGQDWRLLGTYNALDSQRVFRLGAALGRRFVRVPIPPVSPDLFRSVLDSRAGDLPPNLRTKIVRLYEAHFSEEATRLGPALFLGMCTYIRSALDARIPGHAAFLEATNVVADSDIGQSGLVPAQLGFAGEGEAPAGELAPEAANVHSVMSALMDSILSEAYVLNVGTHLAQLEEPDFERLALRAKVSAALGDKEIEWMSEMMRALA